MVDQSVFKREEINVNVNSRLNNSLAFSCDSLREWLFQPIMLPDSAISNQSEQQRLFTVWIRARSRLEYSASQSNNSGLVINLAG